MYGIKDGGGMVWSGVEYSGMGWRQCNIASFISYFSTFLLWRKIQIKLNFPIGIIKSFFLSTEFIIFGTLKRKYYLLGRPSVKIK